MLVIDRKSHILRNERHEFAYGLHEAFTPRELIERFTKVLTSQI